MTPRRASESVWEILEDARLGGVQPRYYLGRSEERLVRIPDDLRKCAVFLGYEDGGIIKPAGTAFFVAVPLEEMREHNALYLVTAKHLLAGIRKLSIANQNTYVRLNSREGDSDWTKMPESTEWYEHPTDKNVDVAVLHVLIPRQQFEFSYIPVHNAATPDVIKNEGIGVGDEVFVIGLFVNHHGRQRILHP
jgi:hypothetical protein